MGATCGCIGDDAEDEFSVTEDIYLKKRFSNVIQCAQNGQIQVPTVDLERDFTIMINTLSVLNPAVNV